MTEKILQLMNERRTTKTLDPTGYRKRLKQQKRIGTT